MATSSACDLPNPLHGTTLASVQYTKVLSDAIRSGASGDALVRRRINDLRWTSVRQRGCSEDLRLQGITFHAEALQVGSRDFWVFAKMALSSNLISGGIENFSQFAVWRSRMAAN